MAFEEATTKEVFEAYVARFLAPTLHEGQVMVMDNLQAHKNERVRELIEGEDCELLVSAALLAPGSNPIEEASSKIKSGLRRAGSIYGRL